MNCVDAKFRLNNADPSELAADPALRDHLQGCAECRDYAEELRMTRLLRSMPVPPASEGFADRALARAWETAHPQPASPSPARFAWAGVAASVVLAAVLFTQLGDSPVQVEALPDIQVVQLEPNVVRPVTVRLVSREAMPEATVTIHLDSNVALAGYPDTDTLSWQTSIAAGSNDLSLPVELLGQQRGEILIEIQSGSARKKMKLALEPQTESSSFSSGSPIAI
jgi:hypothetical protein